MNYFKVHSATNLVVAVVASSQAPQDDNTFHWMKAYSRQLDTYHVQLRKGFNPSLQDVQASPPALPEILPLSVSERKEMVSDIKQKHKSTSVAALAYAWRVSETTIKNVIKTL